MKNLLVCRKNLCWWNDLGFSCDVNREVNWFDRRIR